jgi:hypothetical protein
MTRTIPSQKQMEDSRQTHTFRDENDNRLVVITKLLPNGEYGAWVDAVDFDHPLGTGDTIMAAIADLHAALEEI